MISPAKVLRAMGIEPSLLTGWDVVLAMSITIGTLGLLLLAIRFLGGK